MLSGFGVRSTSKTSSTPVVPLFEAVDVGMPVREKLMVATLVEGVPATVLACATVAVDAANMAYATGARPRVRSFDDVPVLRRI